LTETIRLSRLMLEDIDVGSGTRSVRLADGSTATLTQVSLPGLCSLKTTRLNASNGASVLTATGLIPANSRVLAVTSKVTVTLGTGGGLTAFSIGDGTIVDRWGTQSTLTANAETDQGDFTDDTIPIYASATDVVVSALGGTFASTGQIELSVFYWLLTHRAA
jgi:hypothetical protein